jgi:hypothetical protein
MTQFPASALTEENAVTYCTNLHEDVKENFARFLVAVLKFVKGHGEGVSKMEASIGDFQRLNALYV